MTRNKMDDSERTELIEYLSDELPPAVQSVRRADPTFRRKLTRIDEVREALARVAADDEAAPDGVWETVAKRAYLRREIWRRRAALHARRALPWAALIVAAVGLAVLFRDADNVPSSELEALLDESKRLEHARVQVAMDPSRWSATEQGLALRIADLDRELVSLEMSDDERGRVTALWKTRVDLLESWLAEERDGGPRKVVY